MADALAQAQVDRLSSIMLLMGTQSAQAAIEKFLGDPKKFQSWIKSIEKYILVVHGDTNSKKTFALQSSEGPVSEFLVRYFQSNPDSTWQQTYEQLKSRFGDIVDSQHALQVLRGARQKSGEIIQVFAERLICMAEQAWPDQDLTGPLIARQLIDCLIDGLTDSGIARKVMRENVITFAQAVQIAVSEQNLTRKFELRNRTVPTTKSIRAGVRQEEPMEVDTFKGQCFKCGKSGHRAIECRPKVVRKRVYEMTARKVDKQTSCYKCGEAGHIIATCPNRGNPNTGCCWLCGQLGHRRSECPRNARKENLGGGATQPKGQALA